MALNFKKSQIHIMVGFALSKQIPWQYDLTLGNQGVNNQGCTKKDDDEDDDDEENDNVDNQTV